MSRGYVHLRVENRHGSFYYGDGLVINHLSENIALLILQHGRNIQPEILRVQLRRETVRHALLLARRYTHTISLRGEIAHDDGRVGGARDVRGRYEGAADDGDDYGGGLVVGDAEDGAGGVAVDEFDAEDFGLREGGLDLDGEGGGLQFAVVGEFVGEFFDVFDLYRIVLSGGVVGWCFELDWSYL